METLPSIRDQIAAEADEWLLKLQSADHANRYREAFTDWLMQSPAHIEAYLAVSRAWHALGVPHPQSWSADALIAAAQREAEPNNVVRLRSAELPRLPLERPLRLPSLTSRRWPARAAAVVLVAAAGAWLFQDYRSPQNDLKTAVGEQRSVTLADGSVVFLNTNSELKVRWSAGERHIDLLRGEARFLVAKNSARPFVVATREATVRAVGTVFNVLTGESMTQVAVLEGRVEVGHIANPAAAPPPDLGKAELLLTAGQRAAVTREGVQADVGAPIERVAAWTERRLVFRGEPLSAVLAEFNRYRLQALIVDDAGLAQIRINGVFDLDDPASLVAYLRNFESVQVEQRSDGSEHLSRGPH